MNRVTNAALTNLIVTMTFKKLGEPIEWKLVKPNQKVKRAYRYISFLIDHLTSPEHLHHHTFQTIGKTFTEYQLDVLRVKKEFEQNINVSTELLKLINLIKCEAMMNLNCSKFLKT